jgi:hypothetical protein
LHITYDEIYWHMNIDNFGNTPECQLNSI